LPIPFVWGPVGGGESAPKAFWRSFGLSGVLFEVQRELARWLGEHDPYTRRTAQRSTMALATTEETAARVRKLGARSVQVLSAIGLAQEDVRQLKRSSLGDEPPLRFISIGRLLGWKGFHLGLRAFAEARLADAEYWIVGDGPERRSLEVLARRLGVAHKVWFWGHLPREDTLSKIERCHVLVHPSLHDSGGGVCLEAMAAGRPVVCLDIGGPATQVTQETGFKIAARNPRQTVVDLAESMKRLAGSQELRKRMGEAGQERVMQEFSWGQKAEKMSVLYHSVLGEQTASRRTRGYG
jgi:glycosyltransferase involved in cell wall biosynthesis